MSSWYRMLLLHWNWHPLMGCPINAPLVSQVYIRKWCTLINHFPDIPTILFYYSWNFKFWHFEYKLHGKHGLGDKTLVVHFFHQQLGPSFLSLRPEFKIFNGKKAYTHHSIFFNWSFKFEHFEYKLHVKHGLGDKTVLVHFFINNWH